MDRRTIAVAAITVLLFGLMVFASALGVSDPGKSVKISKIQHMAHPPIDNVALSNAVNPTGGFQLSDTYGEIGPKLVEAGVIDIQKIKDPGNHNSLVFSDRDLAILIRGSREPVLITNQNASFLKIFFWGIGLANQYPILEKGLAKLKNSKSIEEIASVQNWKLSTQNPVELLSKKQILSLTQAQQSRVEEVAKSMYLPCCDTSASQAECSHSMAMLGLLEFLGSQDASVDQLYAAAKHTAAFWFPQQTLEEATFFIATQLKNYPDVDGRTILNYENSSSTGFQNVHQWLAENGMLKDDNNIQLNCAD